MEWTEGRKLAKITYNNQDTTYEYNHEGFRTKKTLSDGSYILYDIVDGVYVGETRYNASGSVAVYIRYILDEGNSPVGISLWYPATGSWTDYHFVKNLQGDVLEVYKVSDGSLAASYTYDSWGNILSQSGDLATLNPFRYRSYYYDTQTWFYYLQSRYYDPAIGRFVNADTFTSTGQGIIGNNMFAYCLNNPGILIDHSGAAAHLIVQVAVNDCGGRIPVTTPQIAQTPKEQIRGVINGQATLPYSNMRIGLGSYGKTGCPYIATYNAMQLIGKPQSLESITFEMFWYGAVAYGAGGAGPWATVSYFDAHNVDYTGFYSADSLVSDIAEGSVIVFTVFYPTGWHAMTAQYTNGEYNVFNRYDDLADTKTYSSLNDVYSNGWWIYGFRIDT